MEQPTRYPPPPESHPPTCPQCDAKPSQWAARLVTHGEVRGSAVYGAVTQYRCQRCGHEWEVVWPDGTVPLGGHAAPRREEDMATIPCPWCQRPSALTSETVALSWAGAVVGATRTRPVWECPVCGRFAETT